jgi:hypothetical protein
MKSYILDYSSYINESNNISDYPDVLLSLKKYVEILKKDTKLAKPIFRGSSRLPNESIISFNSKMFFDDEIVLKYIQPRKIRASLTSDNPGYDSMWNIWMSSNEDWEKYPSRKYNANICTLDYNYADMYGTINLVIPINIQNVQFGICSSNDLFSSFKLMSKENNYTIKGFCDFFIMLLSFVQSEKQETKFIINKLFDSYEQIISVLDYLQEYFLEEKITNRNPDKKKLYKWFPNNVERHINLYVKLFNVISENYTMQDFFTEMLHPEKNAFQIANSIEDLLYKIDKDDLKDNEIWFNGDYISITMDNIKSYHDISKKPDLYINFIEDIINNLEQKDTNLSNVEN